MWEEEREEKLQINLWSLQKLVIVLLTISLAKPNDIDDINNAINRNFPINRRC